MQIIKSRQFHPSIQVRLETCASVRMTCRVSRPGVAAGTSFGKRCVSAVIKLMTDLQTGRIDLSNLEQSAAPDRRSQHTGRRQQSAVRTSRRGFRRSRCRWVSREDNTLPAGLQFLGRPWDERHTHSPRLCVRAGHTSSERACTAALTPEVALTGIGAIGGVFRTADSSANDFYRNSGYVQQSANLPIHQSSNDRILVFAGVAQLVRARGSYPRSPGFKSLHRHHFCASFR